MKILLCLAVAIATLTGCGIESNGIWLVMAVDKEVIAMDDSVSVTLVISNASDRSVTTHAQSEYGPCLPGFEVHDEGGRQATMQVICLAILPAKVTLEPGESFQVTTWWKPGISRVDGTPISSGIYRLRGAVLSDDETVRSANFDVLVTDPE
jgi:hypothetical protein